MEPDEVRAVSLVPSGIQRLPPSPRSITKEHVGSPGEDQCWNLTVWCSLSIDFSYCCLLSNWPRGSEHLNLVWCLVWWIWHDDTWGGVGWGTKHGWDLKEPGPVGMQSGGQLENRLCLQRLSGKRCLGLLWSSDCPRAGHCPWCWTYWLRISNTQWGRPGSFFLFCISISNKTHCLL